MAALIISELLFFVVNKFGKVPIDQINKVVNNFYTTGDVRDAKEVLRGEIVRILTPDDADAANDKLARRVIPDLPRLITHSKGDNRGMQETADLLELFVKADELKVIEKLPTFVAAKYDKIPAVKPEDLDICLLARRLAKLEDTVAGHSRALVDVADWPPLGSPSSSSWAAMAKYPASVPQSTAAGVSAQSSIIVQPKPSGQVPSSAVMSVKSRSQPYAGTRRLNGTQEVPSTSTLKGVPRKLHAFVSRLAKDTTVENLEQWLSNVGICDVVCRKIEPPEGRTFHTSAFKVTCDSKYAELFYDEGNWPQGCELRDWVFRARRNDDNNQ